MFRAMFLAEMRKQVVLVDLYVKHGVCMHCVYPHFDLYLKPVHSEIQIVPFINIYKGTLCYG